MSQTSDADDRSFEQQLIERAQLGDREAFEELLRRTARLVLSRVTLETSGRPVAGGQTAEDLVQETFLHAWRAIDQVKDARSFRPWLLAIARNVTVAASRSAGRQKRGSPAGGGRVEDARELSAPGPTPAEQVSHDETRQRVLAVMRSLPEEYRLPLMMRYLAGEDYETISRQLGVSNGSLRGLLHRGLARLRAELKEKGG